MVVGSSPFLRDSTDSNLPMAIVRTAASQEGCAGNAPVEKGRDRPGHARPGWDHPHHQTRRGPAKTSSRPTR